jgi:hypothetical protein
MSALKSPNLTRGLFLASMSAERASSAVDGDSSDDGSP